MILQPCSVELTKIHYYDKNKTERNWAIPTISREIENSYNSNILIKKNVFGQRWVLKINENSNIKKKSKVRVVTYVIVVCSLIIAVGFGLYFSIGECFFFNLIKRPEKRILFNAASHFTQNFSIP